MRSLAAVNANDAAHQAFRRTVYGLLGMPDDPALDPVPVIDLRPVIDVETTPAEATAAV